MNRLINIFISTVLFLFLSFLMACGDDEEPGVTPKETDYTELLSNQVEQIIIPSMITYRDKMSELVSVTQRFASSIDEANLSNLRIVYREANLSYQAAAVHNYFATANLALVETSNLYPIDTTILANLIANKSYNFTTTAQARANGFPAIDFLLYGSNDVVNYFNADTNRIAFLENLVVAMQQKSELLVNQWEGSLKNNFINNGGVALGSSISVQLNQTIIYTEEHIRENKVGIPIGRLGPNDSPIPADPTKIESYYESLYTGNESSTLSFLRKAITEMESIYLGRTSAGVDGQGYDDLLIAREQTSIDTDIKARFTAIYNEIDTRNSISDDELLYQNIQALITLYKSDLLPVLNVQDADGANDGD